MDYRPPEEAEEAWLREGPASLCPVKVARLRPLTLSLPLSLSLMPYLSTSVSQRIKRKKNKLQLSDMMGLPDLQRCSSLGSRRVLMLASHSAVQMSSASVTHQVMRAHERSSQTTAPSWAASSLLVHSSAEEAGRPDGSLNID